MGYIYKIENKINQHKYIGQTKRALEKRWNEHIYHDEGCWALERAIKKYGVSNFSLEVIEECKDEDLNQREIYWIAYYDSYNNGYNLTMGGNTGYKYDYQKIVEEYVKTKSIAKVSKKLGCSHNTVISALEAYGIKRDMWEIKIQAIDPVTLQIKQEFSSLSEAAKYLNGYPGTISEALNGNRKTAYGYFWKKSNEEKNFENIKMNSNRTNQIIIQIDKDTDEEICRYNSIAEANRALGIKQYNGSISRVVTGKGTTAHGYKWKRIYKTKLGEE